MKLLYSSILLIVMNLASTSVVQGNRNVPRLDQITGIGLFTYNGWILDINPDGSGKLTFGSTGGDDARIPKQTFSFQAVYNLLLPHLSDTYHVGKSVAVTLPIKGTPPEIPTYALYLDDRGIVSQLMTEARDKSVPVNPKRFKELLAAHSPVPDDSE